LTTTLWWTLNNDEQHHKKAQWNENLKKKEYTYLKYVLTYPSLYNQSKQSIKIEITYTNKQHFPWKYKQIQSIFIDPLLENNLFNNQDIKCLTLEEMITEKCRATLTRREPAIRDFFDLRYIQTQGVDIFTHKEIIIAKCDEVSERKRSLNGQYDNLEKQITTHLIPVIDDIGNFDLKTIYEQIERLQKELFW